MKDHNDHHDEHHGEHHDEHHSEHYNEHHSERHNDHREDAHDGPGSRTEGSADAGEAASGEWREDRRGDHRRRHGGPRGGRRGRGPRDGDGDRPGFGQERPIAPFDDLGTPDDSPPRNGFSPRTDAGPRGGFGRGGGYGFGGAPHGGQQGGPQAAFADPARRGGHQGGPHGGRRLRPSFGPGDPLDLTSDGPFAEGTGSRGAHRGRRGGRLGGPRGTGRARRGDVRLALLGLLVEAPMNGYQMIKALEERTEGRWRPSPGAVYPALAQLQDEGLIEPVDGEGKIFRLTDSGRGEAERAGERARPWETVVAAEAGAVGALSESLAKLGVAARAAAQSGDEDVVRAVAALLDDTRRRVYRRLADDARADDARADDARADDGNGESDGDDGSDEDRAWPAT